MPLKLPKMVSPGRPVRAADFNALIVAATQLEARLAKLESLELLRLIRRGVVTARTPANPPPEGVPATSVTYTVTLTGGGTLSNVRPWLGRPVPEDDSTFIRPAPVGTAVLVLRLPMDPPDPEGRLDTLALIPEHLVFAECPS